VEAVEVTVVHRRREVDHRSYLDLAVDRRRLLGYLSHEHEQGDAIQG
jgi:hypothetical protein